MLEEVKRLRELWPLGVIDGHNEITLLDADGKEFVTAESKIYGSQTGLIGAASRLVKTLEANAAKLSKQA